jgi:hypothetical protein
MIRAKVLSNGFIYQLIKSGNRSVLYEQKDGERVVGFEVHILRTRPTRVVNGKTLRTCNRWPNNEEFGKWAWTYYILEKAELKHLEIEDKFNSSMPSGKN